MSSTEAGVVADLVTRSLSAPVQTLNLEGRTYVVVRDADGGQKPLEIPAREDRKPVRIESKPVFRDRVSFLVYVERFRSPETLVFGDLGRGTITADLDYHGVGAPSNRTHSATLQFQHSPEWLAWVKNEKRKIGQVEFAEFLEEHIGEIAKPNDGSIADACAELVAKKDVEFKSGVNLRNGSHTLEYSESVREVVRPGKIGVPDAFTLLLRPYTHSQPVIQEAKLRYRIDGGKLQFEYVLLKREETLENAFRAEVVEIEAALGAAVLWGAV